MSEVVDQITVDVPEAHASKVFTDAKGTEYEAVDIPTVNFQLNVPNLKDSISLRLLSSDNVHDIRLFLLETPSTCDLTCYHIAYQGKKINPFSEVGEFPEFMDQEVVVLDIVYDRYDEKTVREHVTHIREILTNPPSFSPNTDFLTNATREDIALKDFNKSIVDAKKRLLSVKPLKNATKAQKKKAQNYMQVSEEQEIASLIPECTLQQFYESNVPEIPMCVRSIAFSHWNPVPSHRSLIGDLMYIDIVTLDGKTYGITATADGFSVNKSTLTQFDPSYDKEAKFATLPTLLNKLNNAFHTNWNQLLNRKYLCHPLQLQTALVPDVSWMQPIAKPTSQPNWNQADACIAGKFGVTSKFRDWSNEFQLAKSLPKSLPRDRLAREIAVSRVYTDFTSAALEGTIAVMEGHIEPINPLEHESAWLYVYNNILYVRCNVVNEEVVHYGGKFTPYENAVVDANIYQYLHNLDHDDITLPIHTLIEYKTVRVIAYGTLTGLFQANLTSSVSGLNNKAYASLDCLKNQEDRGKIEQALTTFGTILHNKPLYMKDEENETPVKSIVNPEVKVLVEADGKPYFMDFTCSLPRDMNFALKEQMAYTMSLEAVKAFTRSKAFSVISEEMKKDDTEKTISEEESKEIGEQRRQKYLSTLHGTQFNCALHTLHEDKLVMSAEEKAQDQALLDELAQYVRTELVGKVINRVINSEHGPSEPLALEELMEKRGLPYRYAGIVFNEVTKLTEANLNEMYAELEAKNVENSKDMAKPTPAILNFLSCLKQVMILQAAKRMYASFAVLLAKNQTKVLGAENMAQLTIKLMNSILTVQPDTPESIAIADAFQGFEHAVAVQEASSIDVHQNFEATQTLTLSDDKTVFHGIWTILRRYIKSMFNFDFTLPIENTEKLSLIRAFCLTNGIKLFAKEYDIVNTPLTVQDLHSISPIVRSLIMQCSDADKMSKAARFLLNKGDIDTAFEYLAETANLRVLSCGALANQLVNDYLIFGKLLSNVGDYNSALDLFYRALIVTQKHYSRDHLYCAAIHVQIAKVLILSDKPLAGLRNLLKALFIVKPLLGEQSLAVAYIHLNLALALFSANKLNESFAHLNKAVEIVTRDFGASAAILMAIFDLYGNMSLYTNDLGKANAGFYQCYKLSVMKLTKEEADKDERVTNYKQTLGKISALISIEKDLQAKKPVEKEKLELYEAYMTDCINAKKEHALTAIYWVDLPDANTDTGVTVDDMLESLENTHDAPEDVPYVLGSLYQKLVKKD